MPTNGNQHITEISRVQLPDIAQDPDLGVRLCATPIPVVASETETGRLYNDVKGVFVKRSEANDTVTFTLEKNGIDLTPLGDFIGLPYDPLVVAFIVDWRQHLINHGAGCYKLRVNFDIAGVTGEYYEGSYELMPYGLHTIEQTVRLYSYFDSYHSAKGINFKDSGFYSSIRFGGRFGNRQPNTEINNIKHTDNIQRKIRRENVNSYELITDPLSECFTREILDFHLVGENEIFVTDNAAMNHSYRYRDYPVILSDTPEMEHTSGRPSSIIATFEDKQLNEYTSYVSSQDPNVIPAPTCLPANYTVQYENGTIIEQGTIPSGGSVTVEVPDIPTCDSATWILEDSNGTQISTGTIASGGSATIVAPDADISLNGEAFPSIPSGGSDNIQVRQENTATQIGSKQGQYFRIADSVITLNTNQVTENVPATNSKNFNLLDQNNDPVAVDYVSGDDVTLDITSGPTGLATSLPIKTGQVLIKNDYDDGFYQDGRLQDTITLDEPNFFGTLDRYTAIDGSQNYSSPIIFIDHSTRQIDGRLVFYRSGQTGSLVNQLNFAENLVDLGYSDWKMCNIALYENLRDIGAERPLQNTPFNTTSDGLYRSASATKNSNNYLCFYNFSAASNHSKVAVLGNSLSLRSILYRIGNISEL